MSKILLDKINNILDIDKDKEYINIKNGKQDYFIYLNQYFKKEEIIKKFDHNLQIEMIFRHDYEEIIENLKKITTFNSLKMFLDKLGINYYEIIKQLNIESKKADPKSAKRVKKELETNDTDDEYLINKKKINEKIITCLLTTVEKFRFLKTESKDLFIETGKELLKLGTCFISGYINDCYLNAPLILYNIDIKINANKVVIIKKSGPIINEKLILFILKQLDSLNKVDLSSITDKQSFIEKIEPLVQYKIEQLDEQIYFDNKVKINTLKFSDVYCVGIFDVEAGKLKEDFIELMNQNVVLLNEKMSHDFEHYTKDEFENNALIQINNPLNIYQKYAVRSAINENTLIYGPPGTGKSEIITTIIANLLIQSKTILVASEKNAALDVIKKRLSKLSIFAFYLKDLENENLFYEQIEKLSFEMGSFYNQEYRDETFNLKEVYDSNDRVKDYNDEIKKFRMILNDDINFSLESDSRGNDYREYLLSINEVNEFIKENKTGINEYWEQYKNKYVKLQSTTEFISKVAEFNWFKEKYELSEDEINKFDFIREELNRFLANNENSQLKLDDFECLKEKVNKLSEFIQNQMMHKDKDFIEEIGKDYFLLKNNYDAINTCKTILNEKNEKNQDSKEGKQQQKTNRDNMVQRVIKNLIKNLTIHDKFLRKLLTSSETEKQNMLQRYYYKSEISTSKILFKAIDKDFNETYLRCIREFEKIKIFKNNIYLKYMLDQDGSIFDPVVVYFYIKKHLLKKSFIDFYNKQIVNFDERVIKEYFKYRVNQIERELININVYNFEKLNKHKHIIERDLPKLINSYLKNNHDFILNIDEVLKEIYIKFIKNKLAKSSKEIQDKIERMFKVVRYETKPNINDFIKEFYECLKIIFPIWLSKPELISFYVPNKEKQFDVGIFDEASQMFLERAYPLVYRCQQLIVAGDDKQMKPEKFSSSEDLFIDSKPLVSEIEFDRSESLLDRVKVSYWNTYTLRNHYRSNAKELIEFSNNNFYNGKLLFVNKNHDLVEALEVHNVAKGSEANQINVEEAKLVLKEIKTQLAYFTKILVICFTKKQREYLSDLINKDGNEEIKKRIKHEKIIIGDMSSVQGDEGDLVIISTVFTKNSHDFGVLSKPRGSNYLNVTVSRAKQKLVVFKSLIADYIKINSFDCNELVYFKNWINYLDEFNNLKKVGEKTLMVDDKNISTFKNDVFDLLFKIKEIKKYKMQRNVKIGTNDIDIAFYKENPKNINLVLILDDWKKNITIQSWFEDIDKEEYLKSRGYEVLRIREQDWLKNKEDVIFKIINQLNKT